MVSRCVVNSFCSCTSFKHRIQVHLKHILGASSWTTTVGKVNWNVPIISSMNLSRVPATLTPLASVKRILKIQVMSRNNGILLLFHRLGGTFMFACLFHINWMLLFDASALAFNNLRLTVTLESNLKPNLFLTWIFSLLEELRFDQIEDFLYYIISPRIGEELRLNRTY